MVNNFHTYQISVLDLLMQEGILPIAAEDFLRAVFENKGYVAGGFAALVARYVLCKDTFDQKDCKFDINRHLYTALNVLQYDKNPYVNAIKGDIDVWFPNLDALEQFKTCDIIRDLNSQGYILKTNKTITGIATESVVGEISSSVRFQVIEKYLLPLEKQISQFDLHNSMVAFDDKQLIYVNTWLDLEKNSTVHAEHLNSEYTVCRILKYINRKNYKTVSHETANLLYNNVFNAVLQLELLKDMSDEEKNKVVDPFKKAFIHKKKNQAVKTVMMHLNKFLDKFTNEQLLMLSILSSSESGYESLISKQENSIYELLLKRGEKAKLQNC